MKKQKGITLIALVITIIVLLILAGVAISIIGGNEGLISKSAEAKFKTNFSQVQEATMLYWTNSEVEDIARGQSRTAQEKLPLKGEINKSDFKRTLVLEMQEIYLDENLDIDSLPLYEIDKTKINSKASHTYIINTDDLQIFDIDGEQFKGKWHHTLRGTGVEGNGESSEDNVSKPASIEDKKENWSKDTGWLEPDIDGFNVDFSWMVYYNQDFTETYEMSVKDYIANGRKSEITVNGVKYYLDNYTQEEKRWANIKTKSNGIEAWWVWIPRFAYKMDNTNQEVDVVFVDMNNNQLRKNDGIIPNEEFSSYILHPAFTEQYKETDSSIVVVKQLRGIWMSKFEASNFDNTNETRIASSGKCYPPDLSGFDKNYTYIEYFDKATNTFTEGPNIASANLNEENNNTNWYDYSNKVWANVKTEANGIESWWVWIPRFAYKMNDANQEVDIIFIDTNDKPYDKEIYGNALKGDMIVHPAFNEMVDGTTVKKLKGIWMSKFEASYDPNSSITRSASSGVCLEPDLDNFDRDNTKIIYWKSDLSDTYEVVLSEYLSSGKQKTITHNGDTYIFYDYKNKIWANIKTEANGIEAWWVWIPRFAYGINNAQEETDVIFVNLDDTPCDKEAYGNVIKPTMRIHPAFNEQYQEQVNDEWVTVPVKDERGNPKKLKGIWMSKYEASLID